MWFEALTVLLEPPVSLAGYFRMKCQSNRKNPEQSDSQRFNGDGCQGSRLDMLGFDKQDLRGQQFTT